jgi:SagB-type dehydrogenase family enzyme
VAAAPVTILLLDLLSDWYAPTNLIRILSQFRPGVVSSAIRKLSKHDLIVQKNSPAALQDEEFANIWSGWLPHAAFFHFGTKDCKYEYRPKELMNLGRRLFHNGPQPHSYKEYSDRSKFSLQRPKNKSLLTEILLKRRTVRSFSGKALPMASFSLLLFYTWGVTGYLNHSNFGRLLLKTSPSSGARHPVEVYVLCMHVEGLKPGLYHYSPRSHRLELIRHVERIHLRGVRYCAGQNWVKGASALFIMTAVFPRAMWKYPLPRAYRTVLLDAGHLCQTFCLVATWLHLSPFCTMALKDSLIECDLEIDGVAESVIYIAGVGMPVAGQATAESAYPFPRVSVNL